MLASPRVSAMLHPSAAAAWMMRSCDPLTVPAGTCDNPLALPGLAARGRQPAYPHSAGARTLQALTLSWSHHQRSIHHGMY